MGGAPKNLDICTCLYQSRRMIILLESIAASMSKRLRMQMMRVWFCYATCKALSGHIKMQLCTRGSHVIICKYVLPFASHNCVMRSVAETDSAAKESKRSGPKKKKKGGKKKKKKKKKKK